MLTSLQWIILSLLVAPCPLIPCYRPTPLIRFPPHSQVTGSTSMSKDPWIGSIHELRVTYVSPYASPSVSLCMFLRGHVTRPPYVCPLRVQVRECSFCDVPPCVCALPYVCPLRVFVPSYDCSFTSIFPPCVCPSVCMSSRVCPRGYLYVCTSPCHW